MIIAYQDPEPRILGLRMIVPEVVKEDDFSNVFNDGIWSFVSKEGCAVCELSRFETVTSDDNVFIEIRSAEDIDKKRW